MLLLSSSAEETDNEEFPADISRADFKFSLSAVSASLFDAGFVLSWEV